MKIALVTPYEYPFPGGVTEHVSHLDRCFRGWGHETKILAPCAERKDLPQNLIVIGRSITEVPFAGSISRLSLSPGIYRTVKRVLKEEQFHVVHLHEPLTPVLAIAALRHSHAANVGTFHAYREDSHLTLGKLGPVFQPLVDKLDAKICVSEAARNYVSTYFPGEYTVIPNGIDFHAYADSPLAPMAPYDDGRPNVLFVGRMDKRKGFDHLIRAFPEVLQAVPQARLLVVGAYDQEDKEPYVRYARMNDLHSVKFIGRVSDEDLVRYYRACDVFCAPSTGFESFGIVLLEAMAAGKAIVASSIAGYRSVLTDGQEGLLVEPGNERLLAEAIVRLLRDSALRREMGERGQRKAAQYDWSIIGRQVMDVYEQVVQKKAQERPYAG